MPNLIYNLEFKIDKAQLAELKNIVDASTTAEVSSLTDKVKSLEKQLKKLKGSQNELNKTDKERINLSKSKRSQINSLLKVKKTKGTLDKQEIKTLKNLTVSLQKETVATKQGALADDSSVIAKEKLSNEFGLATVTIGNATEALENLEKQQKKTNEAVLGGDKSFSIANQTLFGFGDLAQDASQFSQGAAQGFRAIGNNIAFNAEMFGLLVQKTGSAKAAFKTLGSQIFGTGGIILGLNVAITVLTGLLTRTGKKAKEAKESLGDLGSEAELAFKVFDDFAGVLDVQSESLLPKLSDVISKNINVLQKQKDKLDEAKAARFLLNEELELTPKFLITEQISIREQIAAKTDEIKELQASIAARKEESGILRSVSQETVDAILERVKAFEKEEEIRKAVQSLLADELKAAEDAKKAALFQKESSTINTELAQKELDIINASNPLQKRQLQAQLERFKVREDLAIRKKEIDDLELDDEQKKTLKLQEEALARIELEKVNAQERIDIKKTEEETKLDIEKRNAEISKNIEKQKLDVVRQVQSGILNMSRFFAKENKGIALALLGVEKSIAISQVIIDAKQKIFEATAAGAAHTASFNLFGAKLAVSQVALIKAQAVATIAAIASQGLQQGGSISGRGGGGARGGGGGGGTSSGGNNSQNLFAISGGDRSSRINRPLFDNQQSAFVPRAQGGSQRFAITVNNTFDEQTAASVVADGNEQRREGAISAT